MNNRKFIFTYIGLIGGCASGFVTYRIANSLVSPTHLIPKIIFKVGSIVIANTVMNICYKDLLKTQNDFYDVYIRNSKRKDLYD